MTQLRNLFTAPRFPPVEQRFFKGEWPAARHGSLIIYHFRWLMQPIHPTADN
jgi:hypothetical protein